MQGVASSIPDRLCRLIFSTSEAEAKHWYFMLESHIVVSEGVFEAALPALHVMVAALQKCHLSLYAKGYVFELIYQIVNGCADIDSVRRGRAAVADECRAFVRHNLQTLVAVNEETNDELLRLIVDRVNNW